MKRIPIDVTFPNGTTKSFRSVSRVARMLSGNGRASGGLRHQIELNARCALREGWNEVFTVRNNGVYG